MRKSDIVMEMRNKVNNLYDELIQKIKDNNEYGEYSPKCLTETEREFMFWCDEMYHYGETEIDSDGNIINYLAKAIEILFKIKEEN